MDFEGDAFGVIPRGGRRDLEPLGDHLLPRQNEKPSTQCKFLSLIGDSKY
jgi:hypothetical protein